MGFNEDEMFGYKGTVAHMIWALLSSYMCARGLPGGSWHIGAYPSVGHIYTDMRVQFSGQGVIP